MYSCSMRASTLFTLGVTVLAALCAIASYTDTQHRSLPLVKLQVLKFGPFKRLWNGDDKVMLLLNVTADLEPVFTWNTKQIFVFVAAEYSSRNTGFNQIVLWDTIIEKKEDAKIQERVVTVEKLSAKPERDSSCTHPFEGKDLQGRVFNLTMYWNVMPFTGIFLTNKQPLPLNLFSEVGNAQRHLEDIDLSMFPEENEKQCLAEQLSVTRTLHLNQLET